MPSTPPGRLGATDRKRLSKILGRLGSDHPGERAAAGLKADQLVRAAGLTWTELLEPPALPAPAPPPHPFGRRRWFEPDTPQEAAQLVLRHYPMVLSEWERQFAASLVTRWRISPKQRRVMDRITMKARLYATAEENADAR